jgi:hypothetical protein
MREVRARPDDRTAAGTDPLAMSRPTRAPRSSIDEFIESYVCWREACDEVASGYARWLRSPAHDLRLAYAAYQAALDREDGAAHGHRVAQVRLASEAGRPGRRARRLSG